MFLDHALSRRLERTEGAVCASFVTARMAVEPAHGASWQDFAGTYAMYDGVGSPMTQTFGLGVFEPTTTAQLEAIEAYFTSRGAPTNHKVSPFAGVDPLALLVARGYQPLEFSTVLVQPLTAAHVPPAPGALHVGRLAPERRAAWVEASVGGWAADAETAAFIRGLAEASTANAAMTQYLVERDGTVIATGSLGIHGDVALLAGASTIPTARGLGAQRLLLAARLADARARGCTIAMMVTAPGTASQRNAERSGFAVAYTRSKWRRASR